MAITTIQITDEDGTFTEEGKSFFERFRPSNLDHIVERPLRDYQRAAVEACTEALKQHDRASLVMACGTGKTLTTAAILERFSGGQDPHEWISLPESEREANPAEDFFSNTALVLVPSLALAAQTWEELSKTIPAEYAIFGSSGPGERGIEGELDVLVTTDPEVLTHWHQLLMGRRIIISTYHSAPRLAEAQAGYWVDTGDLDIGEVFNAVPAFSIVIADEAHKISGKTDGSDWAVALGERLKINRRLFATATPTSGENAMDDESLFGPRAYTYDMRTAIERGHLSDFHLVAVGVKAGAESGGLLDAIRLAASDYDLTRVASFHSNLTDARAVAEAFESAGVGTAGWLSGRHTWEQRQQALERLRDAEEFHLLTSVNTISEGVNVPTLDGVVFAAPKSSPVQVTQIVGRAIRKNPKRTAPSVVLVPVFVEEGEDEDERLDEEKFADVRKIVQALQEHDPTFISRLGRERFGDSGHGGDEYGDDHGIPLSVIDATGLLDLEDFYARVLEESSGAEGRFYDMLGRTVAFRAKHGRFPSSYQKGTEEARLANWLYSQRRAYLSDGDSGRVLVNEERRRALDEALPGWDYDPLKARFQESVERLVWFVETFNDWPKRNRHRTDDESKLYNDLKNWRYFDRHGTKSGQPMDPEKVRVLDQRLPHWRDAKFYARGGSPSPAEETPVPRQARSLMEQAEELIDFVKTNHRAPAVTSDDADGHRLSRFLDVTRSILRGKQGISEERAAAVALLDDEIGHYHWRNGRKMRSLCQAIELGQFFAEAGRLPGKGEPDLYRRMKNLHYRYKRGQLSEWHVAVLDERAPGWR